MTEEQCTLGFLYETLCDAEYVSRKISHPLLDEISEIRNKVGNDVLKAHQEGIDISYPEEGNVIIHLEEATDEKRKEIAERIASWMQANYPELAKHGTS